MARAFWKGSLAFGLVEIPVTLKPAVKPESLGFTLLDRSDLSPVGNRRYNKATGKEVPWERVIRGYEYESDEYVVLSDEELRRANVEATQTIEIVEFVDVSEIDTVYFDTPYYVEPQKKGSKSYLLLRDSLERAGRAAIATVVLRTRQHLAAVVVRDGVLVLNLLHYANEVIPVPEIEAPRGKAAKATEAEIRMAEKLIDGMTGTWDPARFHDEYREDVLNLVERKVKSGETHTIVEPEAGGERTKATPDLVDLMPLLKESLARKLGGSKSERRAAPARAARPARARRGRKSA